MCLLISEVIIFWKFPLRFNQMKIGLYPILIMGLLCGQSESLFPVLKADRDTGLLDHTKCLLSGSFWRTEKLAGIKAYWNINPLNISDSHKSEKSGSELGSVGSVWRSEAFGIGLKITGCANSQVRTDSAGGGYLTGILFYIYYKLSIQSQSPALMRCTMSGDLSLLSKVVLSWINWQRQSYKRRRSTESIPKSNIAIETNQLHVLRRVRLQGNHFQAIQGFHHVSEQSGYG